MPSEDPDDSRGEKKSVGEFSGEGSGWLTLDPRSLLVGVLQAAGQYVLPVILVLALSMGTAGFFLFALVGSSWIGSVLRYAFFRYRLDPEEIVVREGVLYRTVRHVPYTRIQNLDTAEGILQRLFGLVQVSLETASGKEPEARFRWISHAQCEAIRNRILEARALPTGQGMGASPDGPPAASVSAHVTSDSAREVQDGIDARVLYRVPIRDLVLLGLLSGRGLVIFGALFGLAAQLDFLEFSAVEAWLDEERDWHAALGVLTASILATIVVVMLLSVALTVTAYFRFTLSSGRAAVYTQGGLTTRQTRTIRRRRIQIMQILSPPLLRRFGRAQLRAGTAGARDERAVGRAWLAPIISEALVGPLVRDVQPATGLEGISWQSPHPRAAERLQRRAVFPSTLVVVAALLALKFWGVLAVVILPLAWIHAGHAIRHHGHAMTETAIYGRRGWLWRRLEIVRFDKIQSVLIVESPFDRHWGMATLQIDTACVGGRLTIPFLPVGEAAALQASLTVMAGRSGFRW